MGIFETLLLIVALLLAGGVVAVLWWRNEYLRTEVSETIHPERVVLRIAVPKDNDKSPLAAEQLFSSLHGMSLNKKKSVDHFSLEIASGAYGIHFIVVVKKQYKTFFVNQLYAQYPEAQISEIKDHASTFADFRGNIQGIELQLEKDYYLPLRTFANFEVDPLAGITGAMSNLPNGQEIYLQILARPVADSWQEKGKKHVNALRTKKDEEGKSQQLESGEAEQIKMIETKNNKAGFQFLIRILVKAPDKFTAQRLLNEAAAGFGQYRTANFNRLGLPESLKGFAKIQEDLRRALKKFVGAERAGEKLNIKQRFATRYLDEFAPSIVNTEELASLYHLPSKSVETPNIAWVKSKKLEFPLNVPTQDCRLIGETDYRDQKVRFGIRPEDRLRHMYVIGKTGVGKSTFMQGMVLADIYDGNGVGVIDPHGEMINDLLEKIPPHRAKDVVIFDPGDTEYPVGLNLLQISPDEDKSLVADGIVSVFKKEFGNSWGPRLEYILTNAILTLLHCQNVSILVLPRMLSDANYRKFLLKQVKDPILLKFWEEEYDGKDAKRQSEEISSILNKVGRFTTNPIIRNIVGQVRSSFSIKEIMDEKKIFLVNLAQGKIGEENMALLGGMLVTRLYTNATRRINLQRHQRVPYYLYIDEFQNFSTSTFEKILSEARKFGLSLTVAHQFTDQIEPGIFNAIVGNVGTMVAFNVGPKDAAVFAKEFAPYVDSEDLVGLGRGEIILKMSIDVSQSKPFTARTLLGNFPDTNQVEELIKFSRQKYGIHREKMEEKLFKWVEQKYSKEGVLIQTESQKPRKSGEDSAGPTSDEEKSTSQA